MGTSTPDPRDATGQQAYDATAAVAAAPSSRSDIQVDHAEGVSTRRASTRHSITKPTSTTVRQPVAASANVFSQVPTVTTHYLLQVVVKDTKDPVVQRTLAIPNTFSFRHLERVLATAFGYKGMPGMFEVNTPAWNPGRGRPPRRRQILVYNDEEQRRKWHGWDSEDDETNPDERMVDEVIFKSLLEEFQTLKINYLVRTWVHDVDIVGSIILSKTAFNRTNGHAVCLAGEGHVVMGSSDSMMWQAFKDAYRTNTPTAQQKSYRVYYEQEAASGDPRGLDIGGAWRWDKDNVNHELALLPPAPSPSSSALATLSTSASASASVPAPATTSVTVAPDAGGQDENANANAMDDQNQQVDFESASSSGNGYGASASRAVLQQGMHSQHQSSQAHQWQNHTPHSYGAQGRQEALIHGGQYVPTEASALHQLRYA